MDPDFEPVIEKEALFRYLLVSRVLVLVQSSHPVSRAVRRVAREVHLTFAGKRRAVGVRTLYRWLAAYREDGLEGLLPKPRKTGRPSIVLSSELLAFAAVEKKDDPKASVPEILRRARVLGIVGQKERIDRTTLYRALRRKGVSTRRRKTPKERDARRFAWPHRMQMILCDGKYFRAGADRLKRVALFYLDDATRMGLDVIVGTSENTVLFLTGLYRVFRGVGKMDRLFLDGGPGFVSDDTKAVVANLTVLLIYGEEAYPEGHGAIERFNRTAKDQVLRHFDGRPDVDPDPGALTVRIRHWLQTVYNRSPHEFLDGATPEERFQKDDRPLRLPKSEEDLARRFFVTETRRVTKDHTVPFESIGYEVPRGRAGEQVVLYRRVLTDDLFLLHEGRLVRLHPVDLAENARSRRARKREEAPPDHPTRGAADLAFYRDHGVIVDPDGGFTEPEREEDQA